MKDEVEAIFKSNSSTLPQEVKDATKNFLKELTVVLKEEGARQDKFGLQGRYDITQKAIDIIYKYQPKLEAAPGFWNQIKAHINRFIEWAAGKKDVLSTERTPFSDDSKGAKAVQQYKTEINELRQQVIKENEEPEVEPEIRPSKSS